MTALMSLYTAITTRLENADWVLPTLARFLFAAILLLYFITSGLTKIDGSIFTPSTGAYVQIFPKAFEAAGYDTEALNVFHWLVVVGGTMAEFVLPALIVVGLFTRIAALGMIGFVVVQSLTDIYGHGQADALGAWFDRFPDALILDQRGLWVLLLLVLVVKGAGPISFDRAFKPRTA